ncbi:hypothetical protein Tco_0436472 [Tanacetum coccineum]
MPWQAAQYLSGVVLTLTIVQWFHDGTKPGTLIDLESMMLHLSKKPKQMGYEEVYYYMLPKCSMRTSNMPTVRSGELEQHMADLIQNNLALEERLDKKGTWLYNLENLNIPHKVSQAVNEIVTDAVDWAMQAPLRARFRDLPTVDMKEILQQQMFEDNSYKAHEVHNDLYEALQKSQKLDYSNQCLADQEEARKKKRKKRATPRTPSGSPHSLPPPPPPPEGASGTLAAQELSPTDSLMQDDSIPDEQVHLSDDEDSGNDHLLKADSRQDCKGSNPTLSISKMKAASYPDFGLELLVSEQIWIDDVCTYDISAKYGISHWWFNRQKFYIDRHDSLSRRKDVRTHMRILSVIGIKAYSRYGYDYLSEIILRIADFQEHTIAENDFKNLYPIDFEDLNLLLLQGHLDHLPGSDKQMLSTAVKL